MKTRLEGYPPDSLWFDRLAAGAAGWFVLGVYLDGWAHNHIPDLETFFTLWHGILYSGFFALAGLLVITQYRNVAKGYAWARAVPKGYGIALVGIVLFFIAGVSDFLWHSLFGIEQTVDALFSPPHLILASGGALMIGGPLRAAWMRSGQLQGWRDLLPAVMTLLYILAMLMFMTQFANIMISPTVVTLDYTAPDNEFVLILAAVTGIVSVLVPAIITLSVVLLALKHWVLPFGSLAVIIGGSNLMMYLMRMDDIWRYSPLKYWPVGLIPFVVGLLADVLLRILKASPERWWAVSVFAFALPVVLYTAVLVILELIGGLRWEIHMGLGVPFMVGFLGLGLSILARPSTVYIRPE